MKQFKEYLEEEGLPANEQRTQFILPVVRNLNGRKLKTVKLREGIDFKRNGPKPELGPPPEKLLKSRVVLDWYPRLQAMASARGSGTEEVSIREVNHGSGTEEGSIREENHLRPDRHL